MYTAVIDAGFNSFRLVLYQVFKNSTFRIIGSQKFFVRLGEGLQNNRINEEKIKEAERAFSFFRKIIEDKKVEDVRIVGTSAFRYAENGREVAESLERIIEHEIRIISGEEEGRYAAIGILNTLPITDAIAFDLGGGSLELAEIENGNISRVFQLPFGALKLAHTSEKEIRKTVLDHLSTINIRRHEIIVGSGGNIRSLAKMDSKLSSSILKSIHGYSIPLDSISKYSSLLPSLDLEARTSLPGISRERAYTIHSASVIIDELVKYFAPKSLIVSSFGMREGVLTEGKRLGRKEWLEAVAFFNALEPPIEIFNEVMSSVDYKFSFYVASSAFLSLVFKMAGYLNPFEACYRFIKNSVLPGFMYDEALIMALICKSAYKKVKKKQLKFLKEDITKKEFLNYGSIIRNLVEKYVDGVRL